MVCICQQLLLEAKLKKLPHLKNIHLHLVETTQMIKVRDEKHDYLAKTLFQINIFT